MAVTGQGDRKKGKRRQSRRRKGDIEEVNIRQEKDKEQEVIVRHEAAPSPKKKAQYGVGMKNLQQNGAKLL
jgi:hypothetical protein